MNYFSSMVTILIVLSMRSPVYATALEAEDEGSPQYLYMERLRKVTRTMPGNMDITGEDSAQTPGTLLATSFKDSSGNAGQIGVSGVSSSMDLHFTVPQQSTSAMGNREASRPIAKAELWLFPSFNIPQDGRWYELTLGFVITLEGFNKVREIEVGPVLWRGSDECIMVDLTRTARYIERRLKSRRLNETLVNARVTVHHKEEVLHRTPLEKEWQRTCSSLSPRTSNTSFLVVKYFSDKVDRGRRRRAVVEDQVPTASNYSSSCSLVQYTVKLQSVFGDWVVSPKEPVDVGACFGTCNININPGDFSPRAILKERLRNLRDTAESLLPLSSSHYEISCTEITVDPLVFLIYMEGPDSYVLLEYPVKAKNCGCR